MLRVALLCLIPLLAGGCLAPPGRDISAAEYAQLDRQRALAESAAESSVDRQALERRADLDDQAAELRRERLEAEFEAGEQAARQQQLQLEQAGQLAREQRALALARGRLIRARTELLFFTEVERGLLLDEDALERRQAADELLEVREELAQLELMYGGDPAEATAEIVVARTRRRVERAEERLRLAGLRSRRLTEIEVPGREQELTEAVADAEAEEAAAEREQDLGELQRAAARREREQQQSLSGLRLEDIERCEQRLEEDLRAWERKRERGGVAAG